MNVKKMLEAWKETLILRQAALVRPGELDQPALKAALEFWEGTIKPRATLNGFPVYIAERMPLTNAPSVYIGEMSLPPREENFSEKETKMGTKILRLNLDILKGLLSLDGSKRIKIEGLPPDAKFTAVTTDLFAVNEVGSHFKILFRVESAAFPVRHPCDMVQDGDYLDLTVTELTDDTPVKPVAFREFL